MSHLRLSATLNQWARCAACGHLCNPIVLARLLGRRRDEFWCLRCYHVLAAPAIGTANQEGGA